MGLKTIAWLWIGLSQFVLASSQSIEYNIPAQSLNNALLKFADDSGLEIIFSADLVRGFSAEPLNGRMNVEQALRSLLNNSDLGYLFIDNDTVTLVPQAKTDNDTSESNSLTMDVVTVLAKNNQGVSATSENIIPDERPHSYQASQSISATNTPTPIRQIPQSVHAIKRSLLDDQQNMSISESLQNISGVVPRSELFTPVIEGTLIRGFRAEQLVDGFTQYYNPGDRESIVNVERVEVLKGANAIFYSGGSGSPVGGVINVISKRPQSHAFREIGFRAGSYDYYQPYIDLNQPITDNALFRMTAEYTQSDSWIDTISSERFNINPTLLLTDNADTTLTVHGKLSHWQQPEYQGLPATGTLVGDFKTPVRTFLGPTDMPDSQSDNEMAWLTLAHRINEVWSLDVRARYAQSEFSEKVQTLFNGTSFIADTPLFAPSTWAVVNGELFQRQQEISFQGHSQAKFSFAEAEHIFLIGGDWSELNDKGYIDASTNIDGIVDLSAPDFSNPYKVPGPSISNQSVVNKTYGGYTQLQSHIDERLHTLLSLRLGGVEIGYDNLVSGLSSQTQRLKLLPKVGVAYDLTEHVSLFTAYSEGMRGQPFVTFASSPTPELSRQFEAGLKFDFADRLSGQMAVYQIDRKQVAVATTENAALYNAVGSQRSQGVELDLLWQPTPQLQVLGAYAHTDARFVDGNSGATEGNRLPWVPEDSGRLWANYRFTQNELEGVNIGMGAYFRSGAYLANQNQFKTNGYFTLDAAIGYGVGPIKLAATVKNFLDEAYFQPFQYYGGGFSGGGRVAPGTGRTFFISAAFQF